MNHKVKKTRKIFEKKEEKNFDKRIKFIRSLIKKFNSHREPEIRAEFSFFKNNILTIKFSGISCYTCGFYDYFEDFSSGLEDYGTKARISRIKEYSNKVLVDYELEN